MWRRIFFEDNNTQALLADDAKANHGERHDVMAVPLVLTSIPIPISILILILSLSLTFNLNQNPDSNTNSNLNRSWKRKARERIVLS